MRTKEECDWCMSTQHIERKIEPPMPEEFKHRCSACRELWDETHAECDCCHRVVDLEKEILHKDRYVDVYLCPDCKDRHGFI